MKNFTWESDTNLAILQVCTDDSTDSAWFLLLIYQMLSKTYSIFII